MKKRTGRCDFQVIHAEEGHCVWYGECYKSWDGWHNKNCRYEAPARVLDSEGQKILKKRCPHLIQDAGTEIKTCCDIKQLETLHCNTAMVTILLERCPSCLDNLMKLFCEYTCSPKQSTFINVTEVVEADSQCKSNLCLCFFNFIIFLDDRKKSIYIKIFFE